MAGRRGDQRHSTTSPSGRLSGFTISTNRGAAIAALLATGLSWGAHAARVLVSASLAETTFVLFSLTFIPFFFFLRSKVTEGRRNEPNSYSIVWGREATWTGQTERSKWAYGEHMSQCGQRACFIFTATVALSRMPNGGGLNHVEAIDGAPRPSIDAFERTIAPTGENSCHAPGTRRRCVSDVGRTARMHSQEPRSRSPRLSRKRLGYIDLAAKRERDRERKSTGAANRKFPVF